MRLLPLILISIALLALHSFYWIRYLQRRLRSDSFTKSTRWGSILAFAGIVNSALLANVVTALVLTSVFLILQVSGGSTLTSTTYEIKRIQFWRPWLVEFNPLLSIGVILTVLVALSIYAWRKGRLRWMPIFNRILSEEISQLDTAAEDAQTDQPPSRNLEKLRAKIDGIERRIMELNWKESASSKAGRSKQDLTRRLQRLRKRYQVLDVERRTRRQLEPKDSALLMPKTRWARVEATFLTGGLFIALTATARRLVLLSLLLLIPFFVSLYRPITERRLNDRLDQIYALRSELDARDWEKTKQLLGEPTYELSEDDKRVLAELALAFETAVPIPPPPSAMLGEWYALQSMAVRQEILKRAAGRSPTPLQARIFNPGVAGLDSIELSTLSLYKKAVSSTQPSTKVGESIYGKLEDIARRSPSLMTRIRQEVSTLQRSQEVYGVRRVMLAELLTGRAKDSSSENLTTSTHINRSLFDLAQQDRGRQFLTDLIGGEDLKRTLVNVGTTDSPRYRESPFESPEYGQLMQDFREQLPIDRINAKAKWYPPAVDAPAEGDIDLNAAVIKVEELIKSAKGPNRYRDQARYADPLAQYQDYFPGQLEANHQTERGRIDLRLRESLPNNVTMDGFGPTVAGSMGSVGSFLRARSYFEMRDSSRIGGVLIGREPSDLKTSKLDCTNLEWETEGKSLRLVLTTADGTRFRSRAHSRTLIYQALNYAADGRPVAVTMVDARPVPELKILLHPALIDTALGYRLIVLDRFVSQYVGEDHQKLQQAEKSINAQGALYKYAWAHRVNALSRSEYDSEWDAFINGIINDQEIQKLVEEALKDPKLLADPKTSPLTSKKEYFDSTLVDLILKNAKAGSSAADFGQAIQREALSQYTSAAFSKSKSKELWERWQRSFPEFTTRSGVREKEFDSSPASLMIVDGSKTPNSLDFVLQLSLISPPEFLDNDDQKDSDLPKTWDYPLLKNFIRDRVLAGVSDQRYYGREVLEDVGEFTILQRMFRMAFNGQLGTKFPVEKLIALSNAAASGMPTTKERTLRWQPAAFDTHENNPIIIQLGRELRLSLGVEKDYDAQNGGYWDRLPIIER